MGAPRGERANAALSIGPGPFRSRQGVRRYISLGLSASHQPSARGTTNGRREPVSRRKTLIRLLAVRNRCVVLAQTERRLARCVLYEPGNTPEGVRHEGSLGPASIVGRTGGRR